MALLQNLHPTLRFLGRALPWLLLLAILYLVYQHNALQSTWSLIQTRLHGLPLLYALLAVALMPLNWWLEAMKWRQLLPQTQVHSNTRLLAGVLAGNAVALFTPNRTGDYLGRVWALLPEQWVSGFIATLTGNIAQILVIFFWGGLGFSFYISQRQWMFMGPHSAWIAAGITLLLGLLATVLYFKAPLLQRVKLPRRLSQYQEQARSVLGHYEFKNLAKVLMLSQFRYAVYLLQYLLMLWFVGIDLSLAPAVAGIALIYLVQTGIPLPPISALIARGGIAVAVWQMYPYSEWLVVSATFLLWLLNVILPALVGMVLLKRLKSTV